MRGRLGGVEGTATLRPDIRLVVETGGAQDGIGGSRSQESKQAPGYVGVFSEKWAERVTFQPN